MFDLGVSARGFRDKLVTGDDFHVHVLLLRKPGNVESSSADVRGAGPPSSFPAVQQAGHPPAPGTSAWQRSLTAGPGCCACGRPVLWSAWSWGDPRPVAEWSWCPHSFPESLLCSPVSPGGMQVHSHGGDLLGNTPFTGVVPAPVPLFTCLSVAQGHTNTLFALRLCFWGTTVTNGSQGPRIAPVLKLENPTSWDLPTSSQTVVTLGKPKLRQRGPHRGTQATGPLV